MGDSMEIERIKTGYLEENCYILHIGKECLVIDPGDDFLEIDKIVSKYELKGILITHHHFDHIGALQPLKDKYKIEVYDRNNLSEEKKKIGAFTFEVLYTPGHSIDSISFYFEEENSMFVGDFVFKDTIGRTDLEGGNFTQMKNSIEKLKQYPKNITLYPGHGEKTNLEYEINHNIYF